MNLFFLKYNFKEEMKNHIFSWQEILFALENNIITSDDIIEYSKYILNENTVGFDIVLEIACLNQDENVKPYIYELIKLENKQDVSCIKNKWLYLILNWLYNNRSKIKNSLEIVEELYELFDYPSSITSFVRYLPSNSGDLGNLELNRAKLFKNWKNYLDLFEESIT